MGEQTYFDTDGNPVPAPKTYEEYKVMAQRMLNNEITSKDKQTEINNKTAETGIKTQRTEFQQSFRDDAMTVLKLSDKLGISAEPIPQ